MKKLKEMVSEAQETATAFRYNKVSLCAAWIINEYVCVSLLLPQF